MPLGTRLWPQFHGLDKDADVPFGVHKVRRILPPDPNNDSHRVELRNRVWVNVDEETYNRIAWRLELPGKIIAGMFLASTGMVIAREMARRSTK
jgi:hypothetical protein